MLQCRDTAMVNITMPGVTLKNENCRSFIISWQEPPMMGDGWTANVAIDSPNLFALMGSNGAKVIKARTRLNDLHATAAR